MSTNEAVSPEEVIYFDHTIKDDENGKSAAHITIFGKKEEWDPRLRQLIQDEYADTAYGDILTKIANQIDKDIEKPTTITFDLYKIKEPEDVVTSISEIPEVIEGTELSIMHLSKKINGTNRDVIMLGETHVATKEEMRASSRILPFFKNLGCEGIDTTNFIEGKFFFWVMHNIMYPFLNFIFFYKKRSMSNKSSLSLASDYSIDIKAKKKIIHLEKGWKPSIRMRTFFIGFPIFFIWAMFNLGAATVEVGSEHGWSSGLLYLMFVVLFWILLDKITVLRKILDFVFNIILDHIFDLGPSRNKNMVKNILLALENDDSMENILVMTGKNHTEPMAKILKKKHGFTEKNFK